MSVSVVLNGAGSRRVTVSDETAARIRSVAKELQYKTNTVARSFRTKRTGMIAVVFQHFGRLSPDRPYRIQVLNGVTEALFTQGYSLALCPDMIEPGKADNISDGRFDGVLWCRPDFSDGCGEAIRTANVPVVMMHAPPGSILGVPTFCADNDSAMMRVADHLHALGHKRLAFVIDPVSVKSVEGQARSQALAAAATRLGLAKPTVIVLPRDDHSALTCYAAPDRPHTALVCYSDELAGTVLVTCDRLGVAVPRELSVVGFDSSWFCERTLPRLTSVNQPVERMAYEATSHLITLIRNLEDDKGPTTTVSSIYDCELDIRESTGPVVTV